MQNTESMKANNKPMKEGLETDLSTEKILILSVVQKHPFSFGQCLIGNSIMVMLQY
jgi:hypothetical protein